MVDGLFADLFHGNPETGKAMGANGTFWTEQPLGDAGNLTRSSVRIRRGQTPPKLLNLTPHALQKSGSEPREHHLVTAAA